MKGKDVLKNGAKIIVAGVAVALFLAAISSFSASLETNTMSGLWDAASTDAKLVFIGVILAGLLAS